MGAPLSNTKPKVPHHRALRNEHPPLSAGLKIIKPTAMSRTWMTAGLDQPNTQEATGPTATIGVRARIKQKTTQSNYDSQRRNPNHIVNHVWVVVCHA